MVAFTGVDGLARVTATGAALLVNGTVTFTVSGGPVRITDLVSVCTVADADTVASTLQWTANGTVGAATTFTGASGSLALFAAGGIVYCDLTALTTSPVITQTEGVALAGPATSTGGGIYVPAGTIDMVIGTADGTSALFAHYLRWVPLRPDVKVTAAF